MVASCICCCCPACPTCPTSRVASDRSGGAGFPLGSLDMVVEVVVDEVARGGMFMLRTDSRMICRIVLRKALRNSPVLLRVCARLSNRKERLCHLTKKVMQKKVKSGFSAAAQTKSLQCRARGRTQPYKHIISLKFRTYYIQRGQAYFMGCIHYAHPTIEIRPA